MSFLRKKLGVKREESVICYINRVFAPGLDEGVGGLWKVRLDRVFLREIGRGGKLGQGEGRVVEEWEGREGFTGGWSGEYCEG